MVTCSFCDEPAIAGWPENGKQLNVCYRHSFPGNRPASRFKLYVWVNSYPVMYGNSLVFAVAESVGHAKLVAMQSKRGFWNGRETDVPDGKDRSTELGEPTYTVDIPCAEWHEFGE
jgi:hypothetical protein